MDSWAKQLEITRLREVNASLLAALEAFMSASGHGIDDTELGCCALGDAVVCARAAIVKARGNGAPASAERSGAAPDGATAPGAGETVKCSWCGGALLYHAASQPADEADAEANNHRGQAAKGPEGGAAPPAAGSREDA